MSYFLPTDDQYRILFRVLDERIRQDEKWGEQNHFDLYWYAVLAEEVGEVAKALLEQPLALRDQDLEKEIVEVIAVCFSWLESKLRRERRANEPPPIPYYPWVDFSYREPAPHVEQRVEQDGVHLPTVYFDEPEAEPEPTLDTKIGDILVPPPGGWYPEEAAVTLRLPTCGFAPDAGPFRLGYDDPEV